jgi:hypothetical protein
LGLAGPVTNNVANEAKIDIAYEGSGDMPETARVYTRAHARERSETRSLGFFCVAMSRELFNKAGPLDEDFGQGWFEDDDYCNRVRLAGYRIAIAHDVFIHHHQSAAFSLMEDQKRQELFARNRAIYERKWGAWSPYRKPRS